MADPYISSKGLSTRTGGNLNEIHVQIDPGSGLEVTGGQVRQSHYQRALNKAQGGVKNYMSIIREGSSHVMHALLVALLLFFVFYLLYKFSRR